MEGTPLTLSKIIMIAEDVFQFFITIAEIGAIAMIIYGGFVMATSRGNAEKFNSGKKTLLYSIIGLAVIFGVGIIVSTIASFGQDPTNILR